ncbi:MAG: 1-deoxy-D-xylulose-5-phosphate reductoisomerase [Lachnospiraceae bacterium]|nr:1-deoxy-D-xylulose-5-phosphate reductoisomerase [Lachnospiraceae bacterium]
MKKVAILGSTGSIGTQSLDVVRHHEDLQVVALSAGRNAALLEQQAREFHPDLVAIWDEEAAADLRVKLADLNITVVSGMEGMIQVAVHEAADIVVTAIVGMIGIRPTLEAIRAGKDIALANKETLVTAGHLVMPLAREKGVQILPVDSEHCAIFQCLQGAAHRDIHKLLITASGGPFRGKKTEDLAKVTVQQALAHPNWAMGAKITIDSATMVNKGLEVMEARWLFDVDLDDIQVVIQPKSIIHSMVEYKDGAVLAQLAPPDMRMAIQYALKYPEHCDMELPHLDFTQLREILFEVPDNDTFRGLPMAIQAGKTGGSMPVVFNAANEWANAAFLRGEIGFLDIYDRIQDCMSRHSVIENPDLDTILATEQEVYSYLSSSGS